jgi:hypothetical protein
MPSETVYLARDEGSLSGGLLDRSGCVWVWGNAEDQPDDCSICEAEVWEGWQCLDGGEVICSEHVEIVPEWMRLRLSADLDESHAFHNRLVEMRCIVGLALIDTFANAKHAPNRYLGWVVTE